MSMPPYEPPSHRSSAFNCPACHAYARMTWGTAAANTSTYGTSYSSVDGVTFARCGRCQEWSIWLESEMLHPRSVSVEDPNDDLPDAVKDDYKEAATILQDSPRGAAALLRLAIQKLCDTLVEGEADLNKKIGTLVSIGLDSRIQKALDTVRVIGNEAVHPGQVDLNDSPDTANQLFKLVNIIGQRMITEPKEVDELYQMLPPEKLDGIEKRDKKGA